MNDKQQIEEILSSLCPIYNKGMCGYSIIDCEKPCIHIDEAERINNKFNEIIKQTAREIYQELQGHGTTYVKKWIKERYGVEVEE